MLGTAADKPCKQRNRDAGLLSPQYTIFHGFAQQQVRADHQRQPDITEYARKRREDICGDHVGKLHDLVKRRCENAAERAIPGTKCRTKRTWQDTQGHWAHERRYFPCLRGKRPRV